MLDGEGRVENVSRWYRDLPIVSTLEAIVYLVADFIGFLPNYAVSNS
jgi:hypothetical protein